MFRHLLDGSRAANRYGWQWSVGSMTSESYGFSRWQVQRRARQWCESCPLATACPIEDWPTSTAGEPIDDALLRSGPDLRGPQEPMVTGTPDAVWLTAESLGARDPALVAWPACDGGVRVRRTAAVPTSSQREAARLHRRDVGRTRRAPFGAGPAGRPGDRALQGVALASTFAPVPGYRKRAAQLDIVATHPYPWLVPPAGGDVRSHSAWIRRSAARP